MIAPAVFNYLLYLKYSLKYSAFKLDSSIIFRISEAQAPVQRFCGSRGTLLACCSSANGGMLSPSCVTCQECAGCSRQHISEAVLDHPALLLLV